MPAAMAPEETITASYPAFLAEDTSRRQTVKDGLAQGSPFGGQDPAADLEHETAGVFQNFLAGHESSSSGCFSGRLLDQGPQKLRQPLSGQGGYGIDFFFSASGNSVAPGEVFPWPSGISILFRATTCGFSLKVSSRTGPVPGLRFHNPESGRAGKDRRGRGREGEGRFAPRGGEISIPTRRPRGPLR